MYTKDKTTRVTLRLNEAQFRYVKDSADVLGVSPSDFLRMVVNASMSVNKTLRTTTTISSGTVQTTIEQESEGARRENEQADFDHLL